MTLRVIPSREDGEESLSQARRGSLALFGARDDTAGDIIAGA
jgi:hypothetical protein